MIEFNSRIDIHDCMGRYICYSWTRFGLNFVNLSNVNRFTFYFLPFFSFFFFVHALSFDVGIFDRQ